MNTVVIEEYTASAEGGWRARLWLDDRDGRVVVMCDGHVWMYCWPKSQRGTRNGTAETLAEWVHDASIDYVAGKMDADEWFDCEATVKAAREAVGELRRAERLTREDARELYEGALEIGDERAAEEWRSRLISCYSDGWEYAVMCYAVEPSFRRAYDMLWPLLRPVKTAPPPADPNWRPW